MEHTLVRLAETAAWLFFIVFVFAVIGVVATIRWIIDRVTAGERAVESEVRSVGEHLHHHND
ncbi:MAG TPA: hypothetical protein VFN49_03800 [Candidatus Aquilonibacter sp.]|nr:hypothetical protein [Candidatus Aquilonibacter sp.]